MAHKGSIPKTPPEFAKYDTGTKCEHRKAIVINNTCKEAERNKVVDMFKDLGFKEPIVHENLKCKAIKELLEEESKNLSKAVRCFACAIISLGSSSHVYEADDIAMLDINEDIISYFKGDACNVLLGKPKLFFIQTIPEKNGSEEATCDDEDHVIPCEADLLIVHSVRDEYGSKDAPLSFIDALTGSVKAASDKDLLSILTSMNRKIAKAEQSEKRKSQLPVTSSTLRKEVYFNKLSS